jgi:hypothetical protein
MSSMATRNYKSADAVNPRGGYQKPFVVTAPILVHGDGHYVKPNMVALKYPDFKKDVDPDVHVIVFNYIVKANARTSKKYIINMFSYTLKNMASNWCHNYVLKFPNCIFSEFT